MNNIKKGVEIDLTVNNANLLKTVTDDIDKLDVAIEKNTKSLGTNTQSVLDNGGAMGILNSLTSGYAQVVKDAVEASTLFTRAKKVDTVVTQTSTVAKVSENTVMQTTILNRIKDIAVMGASKVASAAMTVATNIATAAQWLWNTAVLANPLIAFIAGLVAATVGLYKLTTFLIDNSRANEAAAEATRKGMIALDNQTATMDKNSKTLVDNNKHKLDMAKANGASAEEIRKLSLKLAEEEVILAKNNATTARSTALKEQNILASLRQAGASDDVIEKQKELFKKANEEFNRYNNQLAVAYENRKTITKRNEVEVATEATAAAKKAEDAKKAATKKANDEAAAAAKKARDDEKQRQLEAYNAGVTAYTDFLEKQKVERKKYAEEKEDEELDDAYAIAQRDITNANEKIKRDIDAANHQMAIEEDLQARKIAAEEVYQQAKSDVLNAGLSILSTFAGKSKAIALTILAVEKGLAIAEIITNASKAIAVTSANVAKIPAVLPPGVPNLAYPIAVATGIKSIAATKISAGANIAAILATSIKSAKGIAGGGGGAGGGAPEPPAPATPQANFNMVGKSDSNILANSINNKQTPVVNAVVVGRDVTSQQEADRNSNNNRTIVD